MNALKGLREKINESLASVLPITAIVLVLSISVAPLTPGALILFLFGAVLLVAGLGLFTLGVDMSMLPMGEGVGVELAKRKKLAIPLLVCFVLGMVVTIAEPDLQVLAHQIQSIPNMVLILAVALGVGVALMVAMLRIRLKVRLSHVLLVCYGVVFVLAFLTPADFLSVAFDSGGVTTGPITVPFIMALGVGMASMRNDKNSGSDSFGFVSLGSVGPILAVMLLGVFYRPESGAYQLASLLEVETTREAAEQFLMALPAHAEEVVTAILPILVVFAVFQLITRRFSLLEVETTREAAEQFLMALPAHAEEVVTAILPILVVFAVFQLITRRFHRYQLGKMAMGLLYTYVGLVMFLTGVNVGFMPAGQMIGSGLAGGAIPWVLVLVGMLVGFFIVRAEPAVQVLAKQVEEVSNGSVSSHAMMRAMSIGVALSVGLAMFRILTGLPILALLIPGYLAAMGLTFVVPQLYTNIAFDSGGVASGPMTTTFLLPLAMGACGAVGGNIMTDAFGIVAMVAMTPLITIQLMGYIGVRKERALAAAPEAAVSGIWYYDHYYDDDDGGQEVNP